MTIPESVTSIGDGAFNGCSSLTDVTIPESVTSIGGYTFYGCSSLESVTIPDSVTSVGDYAFNGCSVLETVKLPSNLYYLGPAAFRDCTALTAIQLPPYISTIYSDTFRGCAALTDIELRNGVQLGEGAFKDCTGLQSLTITETAEGTLYGSTRIGTYAFQNCGALASIRITGDIAEIGDYAFQNCASLTDAAFLGTVDSLGNYVFYNCAALESVTIPYTVTTVNTGVFRGCEALADVYYGGSASDWAAVTIRSFNDPLEAAEIHFDAIPLRVESLTAREKSVLVDNGIHWVLDAYGGKGSLTFDYTVFRNDEVFTTVTGSRERHFWLSIWEEGTYFLRVVVRDSGGNSVTADSESVSAAYPAPCPIPGVTASAEPGMITVNWNYAEGANTYLIQRSVKDSGSWTTLHNNWSGNSYTDSSVEGGVVYLYRVRGRRGSSYGTFTTAAPVQAIAKLDPPESVSSVAAEAQLGKITVSWTAAAGATGYLLQRRVKNDTIWTTLNSNVSGTSYVDSTVLGGTYYQYRVRSRNSAGFGLFKLSSAVLAKALPGPVASITAAATAGKITVSWSASDGATGYILQRRVKDSATWTTLNSNVSGTAYADTTGVGGTVYQYRVRGRNSDGYGSFKASGVVRAIAEILTPGAISAVTARAEAGETTVSWTASEKATAYILQRRVKDDTVWKTLKSNVSGTSYVDTTGVGGTVYQYRVRGRNSDGYGPFKTGSVVRAIAATKLPGPISSVTAQSVGEKVTVSWTASARAATYLIQRQTEGGSWATLKSGVTGTSYVDERVQTGSKYRYRVRGINADGSGAFAQGPEITVTPPAVVNSGTCGNMGDNLIWTLNDAGTLTISGSGDMAEYMAASEPPWFSSDTSEASWPVVSVVIEPGVNSIGAYAFSHGDYSPSAIVNNCIQTVSIPNTVGRISEGAFKDCVGLKAVTIPNSVTQLGMSVFEGCTGLESVVLPDSIPDITDRVFCGCTGLKSVTIPDSVTFLGEYAFSQCTGLTGIEIPDSVTDMGWGVFSGCTGLTAIAIPDSMGYVSNSCFSSCTNLTSVTIPDSITLIDGSAFQSCMKLSSIHIPDGVSYIGDYAFQGCIGLSGMIVPQYCSSVGAGAFQNCTGLKSIFVPTGTYAVGSYLCDGCTSLTSAVIGDVTTIGQFAFRNCTALTEIVLSASVNSVEASAFQGCTGLTDVYWQGTPADWAKVRLRSNNEALSNAKLHCGELPLLCTGVVPDRSRAAAGESITWTASAWGSGTLKFRFFVYKGSTVVYRGSFGDDDRLCYTPAEAGNYKVRVYVRDASGITAELWSAITTVS